MWAKGREGKFAALGCAHTASVAETQEVIDFCARHGIGPDIEMLRIQDVNEACACIEQGEVRFRCVI